MTTLLNSVSIIILAACIVLQQKASNNKIKLLRGTISETRSRLKYEINQQSRLAQDLKSYAQSECEKIRRETFNREHQGNYSVIINNKAVDVPKYDQFTGVKLTKISDSHGINNEALYYDCYKFVQEHSYLSEADIVSSDEINNLGE